MMPVINFELCTGCGNCADVCPPAALSLCDRTIQLDEGLCEECGFCVPQCPAKAIEIKFPVSSND
jgi:MinD superfamily P-loop ATPase